MFRAQTKTPSPSKTLQNVPSKNKASGFPNFLLEGEVPERRVNAGENRVFCLGSTIFCLIIFLKLS